MTTCKRCNGTGVVKIPVKIYAKRLRGVIDSFIIPRNRYTGEIMPLKLKITANTHSDNTLGIIFPYYRNIKQSLLGDETVNMKDYLPVLTENDYEIKSIYSVDGVGLVIEVKDLYKYEDGPW